MKNIKHLKAVLVVAIVCILSGCMTPKPSGFLRDYSEMEPVEGIRAAYGYKNPLADFSGYKKFIIEPVYVYDSQKRDMPWINPNAREELGAYFYDQLSQQFGERHEITDAPGSDTLILRSAITQIKRNIPLLNIHPGTLLGGAGLGAVTIEAEMIDSVTGQRVAAILVKGKGQRVAYHKGLTYWAHDKAVLARFAKAFKLRFYLLASGH